MRRLTLLGRTRACYYRKIATRDFNRGVTIRISIVIPALNEADCIEQTLQPLQLLRQEGHEVILSDGGSKDETLNLAQPLVDQVVSSPPGRASQMNHGASIASGEILWFLHADTLITEDAHTQIISELANATNVWGRFDIRLTGTQMIFRLIETMMNLRSCITGIVTGDQGIFMWQHVFKEVGGFDDIPLMEDIALSRKLKGLSRPLCLQQKLITSSRRWEEQGIFHTILLMWQLRLSYYFGASPNTLAKKYSS